MKANPIYCLPLLSLACSEIKSSDLNTSGFYADLSVVATSDYEALASATYTAGSSTSLTFVELTAGDGVAVESDTESKNLSYCGALGMHSYCETFSDGFAGAIYTFDLKRSAEVSAPDSWLELPASFELLSPAPDESFVEGEAIDIFWDEADGDHVMLVKATGLCISDYSSGEITDFGEMTINAYDLEGFGETGETCSVEITVDRILGGTLDPAYGSGKVQGIQRQSVTIQYSL